MFVVEASTHDLVATLKPRKPPSPTPGPVEAGVAGGEAYLAKSASSAAMVLSFSASASCSAAFSALSCCACNAVCGRGWGGA